MKHGARPLVGPIGVIDAVLVNITSGISEPVIRGWQFGQVIKSRQKIVIL